MMQKWYLSGTSYMREYTTCSLTAEQRSAVNNVSLFSCHLENIQWSVDATVPSMPSTDLIGTQDRQPNHEINSLSVCDWGQQPPPLLSGCHCWRALRSNASGLQSGKGRYSTLGKQRFSAIFHTVCTWTHTQGNKVLHTHAYTQSPVTYFSWQ